MEENTFYSIDTFLYNNIKKNHLLYNKNLYNLCIKSKSLEKIKFKTRWKKYLSEYFCNHINFRNKNHINIFLKKLTNITNLQYEYLLDEYCKFKKNVKNTEYEEQIDVKINYSIDDVTITIGKLFPIKISLIIFNKLINYNSDIVNLLNLLLKYYMLGIDTGYFWSIDKEIYDKLDSIENKYSIECFGSPLNHIIENYCSIFDEDKIYNSIGNFFTYVDKLKEKKKVKRLIVNPPYTELMIEKTIEKIIELKEKIPETEIFFLLPYWEDMICIKELIEREDSDYIIIDGNQYQLYNHITNISFNPPMPLMYIILKGEDNNFNMENIL